ncbi:MAG TPA: AraC family transcriptional regulator [Bradyrhizobium sp.]|uniref:AraC family transcriptional regulator n=1 Tax=Bradyrhizobium sp. TaxID=376 RepID=UPI002C680EB5|nr:AraC family transcriptional regulator [Bradyrhizobium sp.]HLZ02918.1 AraC family transcriptional regulator [Bradyrhizobium sp.]
MARHDPRNTARYWNDLATPGLSLMCAAFTTQEFAPHVHEGFVVAATESGGAEIKSRGVVGRAQTSKLFVFNPGEPHSGWMGRSHEWRYRAFYVPRSTIDDLTRGLGTSRPGYFCRNEFGDEDLIRWFLRLHGELERGTDRLRTRELFLDAFATLFQRHADGSPPPLAAPKDRTLLAAVDAIMQDRYHDHLSLDDLAGQVGLTPFQLIGLFKRTVSLTPHAYLTQIRLARACGHLARGETIAHTAIVCGFYDQAAFTHHFKRCYGITPRQYARAAG